MELNITTKNGKKEYSLRFRRDKDFSEIELNNELIFYGKRHILSKYIRGIEKLNHSDWQAALLKVYPNLDNRINHFGDTETVMLFRAFYILHRLLPLDGTDPHIQKTFSSLFDVVRFDDNLDPQVNLFIYFIPHDLIVLDPIALEKLCEISFLTRANLKYKGKYDVTVYFIPFNLPNAQIKDHNAKQLWHKIKKSFQSRLGA